MIESDELTATRIAGGGEPRPIGRFRRFWAAHPRLTDVLLAVACLLVGNPVSILSAEQTSGPSVPEWGAIAAGVTIVISTLALLWRRKYPLTVFIIAYVAMLASVLGGFTVTGAAIMVASYSLAVYARPRLAWLAFAIGVIIALPWNIAVSSLLAFPLPLIPAFTIVMTVLMLLGVLMGSNVFGTRRYQQALIDRARQLEVESDQRAELARAAERARIAREMHDIVSHSLTVVVTLAEGARATDDPARRDRATAAIADTARDALTDMRAMLGVLRADDATAELAPTAPESVASIVARAREAGYPVTLRRTGDAAAPAPVALAISRITQEAITNAMRHADSTSIDVSVTQTEAETVIIVENDGVRPATQQPGYGLRGLRERAEHLGGTLDASGNGRLWRLEARLPAQEGAGDD